MADELEEKIKQELALQDEPAHDDPSPDDPAGDPEPEDEPEVWTQERWQESQEETARQYGWKPFDEYVEEGGDPKEWRTAEGFNIRGEFIGKLRDKDKDVERIVEDRVSGVKKLYEAQINTLKGKRDQAITEGDVEQVHAIEKEINELEKPPVQQPRVDQELENEWNAKNTWINEDSPKSVYAISQYTKYVQMGMGTADALSKVDKDIAREFPQQTKQRTTIPSGEKGKGPKGFQKPKAASVSFDDLTPAEKTIWDNMPEAWGNDVDKFLKAVADDRQAS